MSRWILGLLNFSQIGVCVCVSEANVPQDDAKATTRKVLTENAVVVLEAIESVGPTDPGTIAVNL